MCGCCLREEGGRDSGEGRGAQRDTLQPHGKKYCGKPPASAW